MSDLPGPVVCFVCGAVIFGSDEAAAAHEKWHATVTETLVGLVNILQQYEAEARRHGWQL